MSLLATPFTRAVGVEVPLICGPMYPCSNPELVAAVSEAGGLGVLQPISLTYVHGHEYREGIRLMKRLTGKPLGMNALIEATSRSYHQRMVAWVQEALEEGIRFFVTSLGNPRWVVDAVAPYGGVVYHDVTERKWAAKALQGGVHGLIAVNRRAGGHAGARSAEQLFEDLGGLGVPLVCAGGISTPEQFVATLRMGYAAVQMGTRFIATEECRTSQPYKQAILDADEADIVLTERITGVPVAVINTPYIQRLGTKAGPLARWMLKGRTTKKWMRMLYGVKSVWQLKRSSLDETGSRDYWQAGRSVANIHSIEPAGDIVRACARAAAAA